MVTTIDARSRWTARHSVRVAQLAVADVFDALTTADSVAKQPPPVQSVRLPAPHRVSRAAMH